MPDGVRLLYRSRHIYLLLSALLNLLVGLHYRQPTDAKVAGFAGSMLVLIAPAFLFAAFYFDSPRTDLTTPLSHIGIYIIAIGTALMAWANRKLGDVAEY